MTVIGKAVCLVWLVLSISAAITCAQPAAEKGVLVLDWYNISSDIRDPQRRGLEALSPTERRILKLLADYKTSKQIAEELFISRRTVENHRTNICQKLDIHGSHALMKFALEHKAALSE